MARNARRDAEQAVASCIHVRSNPGWSTGLFSENAPRTATTAVRPTSAIRRATCICLQPIRSANAIWPDERARIAVSNLYPSPTCSHPPVPTAAYCSTILVPRHAGLCSSTRFQPLPACCCPTCVFPGPKSTVPTAIPAKPLGAFSTVRGDIPAVPSGTFPISTAATTINVVRIACAHGSFRPTTGRLGLAPFVLTHPIDIQSPHPTQRTRPFSQLRLGITHRYSVRPPGHIAASLGTDPPALRSGYATTAAVLSTPAAA